MLGKVNNLEIDRLCLVELADPVKINFIIFELLLIIKFKKLNYNTCIALIVCQFFLSLSKFY